MSRDTICAPGFAPRVSESHPGGDDDAQVGEGGYDHGVWTEFPQSYSSGCDSQG